MNKRNIAAPCQPVLTSSSRLPLETLLLLPLLSDLRELPLIVLPRPALLGLSPGVVLHSLHLLLPSFHQLVVALADLLLLCHAGSISFIFMRFSNVSTKLNEPQTPNDLDEDSVRRITNAQHHLSNYCVQWLLKTADENGCVYACIYHPGVKKK